MVPHHRIRIEGRNLVIGRTGAVIPLTWALARDATRRASFVTAVGAIRASRRLRGRPVRARVATSPMKVAPYYHAWAIAALADVALVGPDPDADARLFFHDDTTAEQGVADALNGRCTDIRKSRVARVFADVFGYPLAVDPTRHEGPLVARSEANGVHDGRVLDGPIAEPDPDTCYTRLVRTDAPDGLCSDLRTYVVGGRIPVVVEKRRPVRERFANRDQEDHLREPSEVFTPAERDDLVAFARAIGLDLGAMDVLRDRTDGRIYVVDVNKTDMGPPSALSLRARLRMVRRLSAAFAELVSERATDGIVDDAGLAPTETGGATDAG